MLCRSTTIVASVVHLGKCVVVVVDDLLELVVEVLHQRSRSVIIVVLVDLVGFVVSHLLALGKDVGVVGLVLEDG